MPPARLALYGATLAVALSTVRALLVGAPPLAVSIAVLFAYAVLLLAGVLFVRLRVFADAVVRGPSGARGVVLTFDDGPHPRWTPAVLHALRSRGARATFFLIARKAEAHPELVRDILAAGHTVGLHSYEHDRLLALRSERRVRADLTRGVETLTALTGAAPTLFRPPVGHTNPTIARVADALDLTIVGWTVSGLDGVERARPAAVAARIRRRLRDGAIVALHDAPERGEREPAAVRALPAILDAIEAQGLDVVPLTDWTERS